MKHVLHALHLTTMEAASTNARMLQREQGNFFVNLLWPKYDLFSFVVLFMLMLQVVSVCHAIMSVQQDVMGR